MESEHLEKAKELASKLSDKLAGRFEVHKEFDICLDLMMELADLESELEKLPS